MYIQYICMHYYFTYILKLYNAGYKLYNPEYLLKFKLLVVLKVSSNNHEPGMTQLFSLHNSHWCCVDGTITPAMSKTKQS